jgi:hypothetical protein
MRTICALANFFMSCPKFIIAQVAFPIRLQQCVNSQQVGLVVKRLHK